MTSAQRPIVHIAVFRPSRTACTGSTCSWKTETTTACTALARTTTTGFQTFESHDFGKLIGKSRVLGEELHDPAADGDHEQAPFATGSVLDELEDVGEQGGKVHLSERNGEQRNETNHDGSPATSMWKLSPSPSIWWRLMSIL